MPTVSNCSSCREIPSASEKKNFRTHVTCEKNRGSWGWVMLMSLIGSYPCVGINLLSYSSKNQRRFQFISKMKKLSKNNHKTTQACLSPHLEFLSTVLSCNKLILQFKKAVLPPCTVTLINDPMATSSKCVPKLKKYSRMSL